MSFETKLSAIHSRSHLHVEVRLRALSAEELRESHPHTEKTTWDHILGVVTAVGLSAAGWTVVGVSVSRLFLR